MERWQDRVALVTGASVGIGAATARMLVKHGMKVVGCARNVEKIQAISQEIDVKSSSGELVALKCDLTKEEDILEMFKEIEAKFGGVDVCINNAGCAFVEPLLDGTTELWKTVLDVNVLGLCICTRESVKSMTKRGVDDGHIINVSSLSGHRVPGTTNNFYAATKFAVRALTEGFRRELRERKSNIRVSQLSPGLVETEFLPRARPGDSAEACQAAYDSRPTLKPEDMADNIVYMLGSPPHVEIHDLLVRPTNQVS